MSLSFQRIPIPHLPLCFPVRVQGSKHSRVTQTNALNTAAAVGTVSVRSLIEPIRKVVARLHGHVIVGKATDLVMNERLLEVETNLNGHSEKFYVPYDKLVIAVGSTSSTHGVPGLENCFQLKTIADAQGIRRRVLGMSSLTLLY